MFTPNEIRRNVCAELEQLDREHLRQLQEILLRQTHEQQSLQHRLFLKYYDNLEERPLIGLESMIMEFPRQLVLMACYERIEEDFEKKVLQLKKDLDGDLKRLRGATEVKRQKMLEAQQQEIADLKQKHTEALQQYLAAAIAQGEDMGKEKDALVAEHQQQLADTEHKHRDEIRDLMSSLLGEQFYMRKTFEVNVRSLKARLDNNLDAMPPMEPVVLLEPQRYLKLRREAREQRRMLHQKEVKKKPEAERKDVKEVSCGSKDMGKPRVVVGNEGSQEECEKEQAVEKNTDEAAHKEDEMKTTEEKKQDDEVQELAESSPPEALQEVEADSEKESPEEVTPAENDLENAPPTEVDDTKEASNTAVNFKEADPQVPQANRPEEVTPMAVPNVAFFGLGPCTLPAMQSLGSFQTPSPPPTPIVYPAHYQPGYYYPPMVGCNGQTGGSGPYPHAYVHAKNPYTLSHPQSVGDHGGPQQLNQPGWPRQLSQPLTFPQQAAAMWPPNGSPNTSYAPMGQMQPNAMLLTASPQHTQFPFATNFNAARPSPHYEHATNWFVPQPTHCAPPHNILARPNCPQSAPGGDGVAPGGPANATYPKYNTPPKQAAQIVKPPNKQFFSRRPPKKQRVVSKDLITLSPPPQKALGSQRPAEGTPEKRITILTNPNRSSNTKSSKRDLEKKKVLLLENCNNEKEEDNSQNCVEGKEAMPSGESQNTNEVVVEEQKEQVEENKESLQAL